MKKLVTVLQTKCSPAICNYQCLAVCPVNHSKEKNKTAGGERLAISVREKTAKPVIHEKRCIGASCGLCVRACPIGAITTVNIPEGTDNETPVHCYNDSLFKLYRLPQVSNNRVVGLLGQNAVGKSTVIEILAGKITPNAGNMQSPDLKSFLRDFSIPGISRYLQDVYNKKISVGYKRQDLRYLLQVAEGRTVREVLTEVDERREFAWYEDFLSLHDLLDKKIEVLSGGELQRTAIAHTFLQDRNVYLVDEPCTFLDVKQRLKLRELFVRQLEQQRSVLVVEHDLAVLDYLTDYVCILFGSPHVFGVVSRPIATKKGINSFLNGYLQEENVSIRTKVINFRRSTKERIFEGTTIKKLSFDGFERHLGQFALKTKQISIYQGETLVILGENGLGKTTFANSLTEILARGSTVGEFEYHDISIKPQVLSRRFGGSVDEFLLENSGRNLRNSDDKLHLLQPLGIWKLLDKPVKELSGGELQRTNIAACLGKNASIYVLDESSAFLDVMERLKITRVIRNVAEKKRRPVIAIEHDLQVADA
ncbi:MAG TPA: ribosome biogenesis/translation initiation ATPase RLI, partial [Candidatus Hodarchaeales archaeon]|nr:ribosome biogenesis/translation initiation ATPase RLI [Candidatus Hodarchaeales archaeon]